MVFIHTFTHFYFCSYLRKLIEEVSVVFHSAATVKFDEDLTKAVKLNVVAVFTIMELCKKMKRLQESFIIFHTNLYISNSFAGPCACLHCLQQYTAQAHF